MDDDRVGDGMADVADAFPDDAPEGRDLDGDGISDNADSDRDGDGLDNELETALGTDPSAPTRLSTTMLPPAGELDAQILVADQADFALDLFRAALPQASEESNLVLAAQPIATVAAMVLAGAEGITQSELERVLRDRLPPDAIHPAFQALFEALEPCTGDLPLAFCMDWASWGEAAYPVGLPFLNTLAGHYGAPVEPLSIRNAFSGGNGAPTGVTNYIKDRLQQTLGEDFFVSVPPIQDVTRLIYGAGLIAEQPWAFPIDPAQSGERAFELLNGNWVLTPTSDLLT